MKYGAVDRARRVVERSRRCSRIGGVVARLSTRALVAGPAEVLDRARRRVGEPVDLLPVVPADVADPDLVRAGPGREAERVAEAVGDDAVVRSRSAPPYSGLSGSAAPVVGIDAAGSCRRGRRDRRACGGPGLRSAPPSAVGGVCVAADAAPAGRRRGCVGIARLPVVDEVEARAVAAAHVERAVGAEGERADRVARELLAPVLDQHLLGAGHHVAGRLQAREPAADDAAVARRTRRQGSDVPPVRPSAAASRRSPRRSV